MMITREKNKKTISLLLSLIIILNLLMIALPITAHAATNLIANPGAETSTGWTVQTWRAGDASYNTDSTYVRSGSRSFKLEAIGPMSYGGFTQTVSGLTVGKQYELSGWHKGYLIDSNFEGVIELSIKMNGTTYIFSDDISSGWKQISNTFTATTTSIDVIMQITNYWGCVYFDDVSLTEKGSGSNFTEQEIEWLAALIFYEARGFTSNYAKELVAQVAVNRVNSTNYDFRNVNTLEAVLKQPGQYGWPSANTTATYIFNNSWRTHPEYSASKDACFAAARKVANGTSVDENGVCWPSNVLFQHSFSNPYALGTGLFRTFTQGVYKLHFNYG